jgi:hypothetical protein
LSQEGVDIRSEADLLCDLVAAHAHPLRQGSLGSKFRLNDASFRLFAQARNTIYRVSGRFDWFLKLPTDGAGRAMEREHLGAAAITGALGTCPEYGGSSIIRVSTEPAFVLASTICGQAMNKVVFTESWLPGGTAANRLEMTFQTLGFLLATMHTRVSIAPGTPAATTRPFETLGAILTRTAETNVVTEAITKWYRHRRISDAGTSFVHGNFRLDNVIRVDGRLGFLDFENCGTGSPSQDLSRPISELLLTRCVPAFPRRRIARCIEAFVSAYASVRPYEPAELWDFVRARLGRYYIETLKKGPLRRRIGGLPVSRSSLDRLALHAFQGAFQEVVPELGGR